MLPEAYLDLKDVFSKTQTTSLPPCGLYDCTIKQLLHHRTALQPREVADEWVHSGRTGNCILPSLLFLSWFFLCVEGQVPVVHWLPWPKLHHGHELLPLISSAFELLQGTCNFTNLDLHNTYHLFQIQEGDEWKLAFNTPSGHYDYLVSPVPG